MEAAHQEAEEAEKAVEAGQSLEAEGAGPSLGEEVVEAQTWRRDLEMGGVGAVNCMEETDPFAMPAGREQRGSLSMRAV